MRATKREYFERFGKVYYLNIVKPALLGKRNQNQRKHGVFEYYDQLLTRMPTQSKCWTLNPTNIIVKNCEEIRGTR